MIISKEKTKFNKYGEMIQDLLNPESLPDPTSDVELIQTHISYVIIGDQFVYKIKKPVNFGFLDFSTLEKRKFFCEKEVELNRRLSEGIYLGVIPVKFDGNRYSLRDVKGEVVDWAVRMKRIPQDILMKEMFQKGRLNNSHIKSISKRISEFHKNAERSEEIDRFGLPESFRVNTDENFDQVEPYIGKTIDERAFHELKRWTDDFYRNKERLFHERINMAKIRDCHGDLHMEHICIGESVFVIDCIEFNDRFRYGDVISDIAFLLMDLDYNGGVELSNMLWKEYIEFSGDGHGEGILKFYKVYRAFVRGKVNSFLIDDESVDRKKKDIAIENARKYFRLAYSYIS